MILFLCLCLHPQIVEIRTPLDEMFIAVSNIHRRRLLVRLKEQDPQEAHEIHTPDDVQTGEEDLDRFLMKMFHLHLPKLEDRGFIRWDNEKETVAKGPRFDEIRPLLELLDNHADELPSDWS